MDLNFLKKLIEFETVATNFSQMSDCIEFCRNELAESGLKSIVITKNKFPSLVCNVKNNSTGLLLTGHLDVIEAKKEQFKPFVKADKVFGRGSVDMKGGCAVAVSVMKKLVEENRCNNVGLVFTCDEETGGHNGMGFLAGKLRARFATTLEPGHNGITVKHKTVLWAKLLAKGKSAHGSMPWLGDNAALKLLNAVPKALSFAKTPKHEAWVNTVSLNALSSGKSTNKIPDSAFALLDYRLTKDSDMDLIEKKLRAIKGVETIILDKSPMLDTNPRNALVKKFSSICTQVYGRKIPFYYGHGSTDLKWLHKSIPAVEFGPYGENYHADNEWVSIKDASRVEKIYLEFSKLF